MEVSRAATDKKFTIRIDKKEVGPDFFYGQFKKFYKLLNNTRT